MPRANPAAVHRADFYALDNALLRSKSTGIHLRRKPTILENDLSTPLIKWGTIIRGVNYVPDAEAVLDATAADEAVKEAELCLRDVYDRKLPIEQEPREWIVVKGIRNLRGKMDGVTKQWYIPVDITGVPILLKKDGMLSDDEDADEEEERAAKFVDLPAPTDAPPFALGRGMKYEVIYDSVVVRASPSVGARPQSRETKGAIVEMFDWDETRKWRAVYDKNQRAGWMLLDHPEFGALLRPRCLPFQVRPVEPLTTAVLEEDLRWLRQFINKGLHVNTRDAGDRTPLMVAAEFRRHGPIVVLCAAGADASLQNFNGETAVDLAQSEATKALVQALSDKQFNYEHCQEAVSGLDGDVRELADDLLGKKIARMKFFQQDQKPNAGEAAKKPEPGPMQRRPKPASTGRADIDEEEAQPEVDVEALAVRGKCALCQLEFRQAIVADCCVALFCSDCVLSRLAGQGSEDGCPGCGAEIPTTGLDFLRQEEAAREVDERLRERKVAQREAALSQQRQAMAAS